MKFFIDTEFIEDGKTIDLISLGVVCENGFEFYAINLDCNYAKASDWVEDNVLNPLGMSRYSFIARALPKRWQNYWRLFEAKMLYPLGLASGFDHISVDWRALDAPSRYPSLRPKEIIASQFLEFVKLHSGDDCIEFWGYYCDYDWVVLCQLFGKMIDLPQGFPMFCLDVKQGAYLSGKTLPPTPDNEHHALADARWIKEAYHVVYGR